MSTNRSTISIPPRRPSNPPENPHMDYKKLADFLFPIGATVLAILVMPLAIEQYPEFFKENRWPLPISVLIVALCWLFPLMLHERAKGIVNWARSHGWFGIVLTSLIAISVCLGLLWGSVKLFRFHSNHLALALKKKEKKPEPNAETVPAPIKSETTPSVSKMSVKPVSLSRIEITNFIGSPARNKITNQPGYFFNVYFENKGSVAAALLARKGKAEHPDHLLSTDELNAIQRQVNEAPDGPLDGYQEIQPGPPGQFFSFPLESDAAEMIGPAQDALSGKTRLYLFFQMKYRDARNLYRG